MNSTGQCINKKILFTIDTLLFTVGSLIFSNSLKTRVITWLKKHEF